MTKKNGANLVAKQILESPDLKTKFANKAGRGNRQRVCRKSAGKPRSATKLTIGLWKRMGSGQGKFSVLCKLIRVPSRVTKYAAGSVRTHDFGIFRRVVRVIGNVVPPSTQTQILAHHAMRAIGEDRGVRDGQPSWTRPVRPPESPSNCFVYASAAHQAVRKDKVSAQQQLMNISSPSCDNVAPAT